MIDVIRKEIMPFVSLTCLQTAKFKTSYLSINLLQQLNRDAASKNAILPRVLLRGTSSYPDMELLAKYKEELYGTAIEQSVRKKGEIHCIGLFADFVDDKFLPEGEGLLEKVADLLGEILLSPKMSGGSFLQEYVDGERTNLIEEIRGQVNEKGGYSINQLVKHMCDGESYATNRLGSEEEAEKIDAKSLTEYYHEILKTATIEIFYCGSADMDRVELAMKSALNSLPRSEPDYDMGTDIRMNTVEEEARYFTEELDVTQGKLALGFRLGEAMDKPCWPEILLFNYIYGGSVNSKLFLNVREKLSLCYYASSIIERHKGIMIVSSGIEFDKYEVAKDEILKQLEAIREGKVEDVEFANAKNEAISDMKTICDSQNRLDDFYLSQAIEGETYGPEDMAEQLEKVTLKKCINIAKSVELDAVYFLKGSDIEEKVAQ